MRAGSYAEYENEIYECGALSKPMVRLFAEERAPRPGFELDRWGRWTRLVDRREVSRLFRVRTTASWRGWQAEVERFADDASAEIYVDGYSQPPLASPPPMKPIPPHELGLRQIDKNIWRGVVPVRDLENISEVVEEVPL
ncbi:hypothetical protein [Cellulomonas fimi]|uniref:Uncharacterized protein n=1 Tax=Cellulomonas fimi TaxID=1708 RepID=A0A7Y0QJ59_CELFI|nr:hypothetical protein [Cellulomonas fimi]NMR21599.1 hypothetical protein [Cellulomonas fimi]